MMDKQALFELMDNADAVYLATADGAVPRIRALVNLRRSDLYPGAAPRCRSEGFTVYLTTSAASEKVRELRANSNASAYYCDAHQYHGVTLTGTVEILSDPELKKQLWCEDWRIYWPEGADAADYVVLRLKPAKAEGWWENNPFKVHTGTL
jgi:general stress protein 26